jgi:hypothetical protein
MEHGNELPETPTILTVEQQQKIDYTAVHVRVFLNQLQEESGSLPYVERLTQIVKDSEAVNELLLLVMPNVHPQWRDAILTGMGEITKAGRALHQALETCRPAYLQDVSLPVKRDIETHLETLFQVYTGIIILLGD